MIDEAKAIAAQQMACSLVVHHRPGIRKVCEHLLTGEDLAKLFEDNAKLQALVAKYVDVAAIAAEQVIPPIAVASSVDL